MNALTTRRARLLTGTAATAVLLALGVPCASANETETVERTVAMKPGGTLTVKNFSGKVEITGTEGQEVSVHAVRRAPRERLDRIKLAVESDGTNVTVDANRQAGRQRDNDNVVETDLVLRVPREANLRVQVFSSPVRVASITGTAHHVKTFSGAVHLADVTGPVEAESFSGALTLAPGAWKAGQAMRLKTFSGDIELRLPGEAAGSLEFESFSGSLDTQLPLTLKSKSKRSLKAELRSGQGGEFELKTFSGDVTLK